ncbi:TetR family transcriptional regulator [Gluconacetobacter sacchari DSM 12717]|nr:TetR/AcrR family transcriptional regulator [Gluconacetobacter sacchari]GBQ27997.1 TetR family transcriptional regulator [Gluconacetobacter sacchari DSM 12717]
MLGAALHGFARKGYDGTGLRQIAEEAGVDPALISHQFGSKFALWKAVVDEIALRLAAARQSIAELHEGPGSTEERVREGLRRFITANCDIPELAKFLSDEMSQPGERQDYILREIWDPYQDAMLPLLREARADGLLRHDGSPELTLMMVMGAVMLPLLMMRRRGLSAGDEADLSRRLLSDVLPMVLPA